MKETGTREQMAPPYLTLYERLTTLVATLESAGRVHEAEALRSMVAEWRPQQELWEARLRQSLSVHHEINNALVGVRGNTQLLLMSPAGQQPGTRERLEVVIRESGRIKEAAGRLRELKLALGGPGTSSLAA